MKALVRIQLPELEPDRSRAVRTCAMLREMANDCEQIALTIERFAASDWAACADYEGGSECMRPYVELSKEFPDEDEAGREIEALDANPALIYDFEWGDETLELPGPARQRQRS